MSTKGEYQGKHQGKQRVAVIFGGCSSEHEISLKSAEAVLTHMDPEKYEIVPVRITPEGRWMWERGPGDAVPAFLSPDRSDGGLVYFEDGVHVLPLDCALPVLHGRNGEDGTVQGLCRLAGIPVAGCGVLSSALCLHKHVAHQLVQAAGIDVPRSVLLRRGAATTGEPCRSETTTRCWREETAQRWREAVRPLGLPVFVKPVQEGSSVGIHRVEREEDLADAIGDAFSYDEEVVVEQEVEGFEVGCAILGGERPLIGAVDEVELTSGWLDFQEKYRTRRQARIHMPARLPQETASRIQSVALRIYRTLRCSGFARVDMFLTPQGRIVFNEVNTIPGLTVHSRYPRMLAGAGIGFSQMIDVLIREAK